MAYFHNLKIHTCTRNLLNLITIPKNKFAALWKPLVIQEKPKIGNYDLILPEYI